LSAEFAWHVACARASVFAVGHPIPDPRSTSPLVARGAAVLALGLLACGHAEPLASPGKAAPVPTSAESIPAGPPTGKLLGSEFVALGARYSVDRRLGYEKIDIVLSTEPATQSCPEAPSTAPSVWLRRWGHPHLEPGASSISAETGGDWEAHYQVREGGRWVGVGVANGLVVIDRVLPDLKVEGQLAACFRDPEGSCVAGQFTATACPIRVDEPVRGAAVMEPGPGDDTPTGPPPPSVPGTSVTVEPRTGLLPTYPCSRCHGGRAPNPERRKLEAFHVVRNTDFSHGEDAFWCYQCHSLDNIDRLRTATGALLTFDEAYRLCTSCHGDKLEAWVRGTHGLIVGNFRGAQRKKSCPACHDPHHPRFPRLKPMKLPAPVRRGSHD